MATLHLLYKDIGKSGWWILISLIPIIGWIIILVFMCLEGHAEENKYGPNPKWGDNID